MHLYISGTYKKIYYLKDKELHEIPYYLQELKHLVSGAVNTDDGLLAPIKGRKAEASHNRTVKRHLEELEAS